MQGGRDWELRTGSRFDANDEIKMRELEAEPNYSLGITRTVPNPSSEGSSPIHTSPALTHARRPTGATWAETATGRGVPGVAGPRRQKPRSEAAHGRTGGGPAVGAESFCRSVGRDTHGTCQKQSGTIIAFSRASAPAALRPPSVLGGSCRMYPRTGARCHGGYWPGCGTKDRRIFSALAEPG